MKGVILAGGLGTRLRPITLEIPKPLLTIHRKPIVEHIVDRFRAAGIAPLYIIVNENDIPLFERWRKDAVPEAALVPEAGRLGTWGGLLKYLGKELDETFVVANGDILNAVSLSDLADDHAASDASITLHTVEVPNPSDFGVFESDAEGVIRKFHYKPEVPPSRYIMSGDYVVEPEVLLRSPVADIVSFETDVLPHEIAAGRVREFRSVGQWHDCGTFDRYEKAILEWPKAV